jgi:hypothetical protein
MVDPPDDAIRKQLRRILASKSFRGRNRDRARALLEHVVEQTLKGNGEDLKERNLGVDVFNRGDGFEGGEDSVVRTTAGRVRGKLLAYYSANPTDTVVINIPIGSYVPEFSLRDGPASSATAVIPRIVLDEKESCSGSTPLDASTGQNAIDLIPSAIPGTSITTRQKAKGEAESHEPVPGSALPTGSAVGRRKRLIAIAATLLVASGAVVWWSLRPPELPADTLVIGLAQFSPTTPATEIFRNRIQQAVENRKYTGPTIKVRLLDHQLNESQRDLLQQARDISGNRVHVVLGASASGENVYRPRMVLVRPFRGFTNADPFRNVLDALQIGMRVDDGEAESIAAISISDLVKLLYSFHYYQSRELAKLETALDGLDDKKLGSLILAACLHDLSRYQTSGEGFAMLRRSILIIEDWFHQTFPWGCVLWNT